MESWKYNMHIYYGHIMIKLKILMLQVYSVYITFVYQEYIFIWESSTGENCLLMYISYNWIDVY